MHTQALYTCSAYELPHGSKPHICRWAALTLSLKYRELDAAIFLDRSVLCGAEDTSPPPPSATLELQVWPQPVFRMQRNAFDAGPAPELDPCANDNDSASEGAASTAGMALDP